MRRVGFANALLAMTAAVPCVAFAQETPGAINDPSTYKGSLANQALEQQAYQQQEAANQAMQQRLDQNYAAYAPPGGGGGLGGGGGGAVVNLRAKPLLPPANNPLLGRWQQRAAKPVDLGLLGALPGVSSIVNSAFAGGCDSVFGKGRVAFTPTQFNWVAPDGHEEILNHVEYHTDGSNVIVIPTDGDISFIFGFTDRDHAVVAFFGCRMEREGAKPAALAASTAPQPAASSAPQQGTIMLRVGEKQGDRFSAPPAGTRIYVTPQDPDANLVKAGFVPDAATPVVEKLFAACKIGQGGSQEQCNRGLQAMVAGSLGFVDTDSEGQAETGAISPGRYYLVGFSPYKGHSLLWHLPVDVKAGANAVSLTPENGSISH